MPPSSQDQLTHRFDKVWDRTAALGLDGVLITHLPNIFFLTGLRASAAAAVVNSTEIVLITDFRYITAARALVASEVAPSNLSVLQVQDSYDETIRDTVSKRGVSRVGVEVDHLSLKRWTWLTDSLGEPVDLVATDGIVEEVRAVKDAGEIACLQTAGRLIARVVAPVLDLVCAGRTEREIAAGIARTLLSAGFEDRAFETIVASGPHSALPHARPDHRRLTRGDLVVLDFGGVYDGYCVDLTRTVCVGERSEDAHRLHAAVLAAQAAAMAAVRPGTLASDIDKAAREVLARYDLAAAFGHSTGHGLGIEVHEAPRIARARQADPAGPAVPLQEGMVFTVEPGVYVPGIGGVRIEDDVLVTRSGCEVLTEAPRDLAVR